MGACVDPWCGQAPDAETAPGPTVRGGRVLSASPRYGRPT